MKLRLVLVACVLLACVAAAGAQQYISGSCSSCMVIGYIDTPTAGGATVATANSFFIGGWGFECASGQPVDRVDVFELGADGYFYALSAGPIYTHLSRPDVQAAYQGACPTVVPDTGFEQFLAAPPSLGVHTYWINLWRGALYESHLRSVTIN